MVQLPRSLGQQTRDLALLKPPRQEKQPQAPSGQKFLWNVQSQPRPLLCDWLPVAPGDWDAMFSVDRTPEAKGGRQPRWHYTRGLLSLCRDKGPSGISHRGLIMLRAAIGVGHGPKAGEAGRNSSRQGQEVQETSWLRPGGAGSSRKNQQYRGNWQLQEEMEPRKQLVVQKKKYLVEHDPYISLTSRWRSRHLWQQLSMQGQQDQWPATADRALVWGRRSLGGFSHCHYGTGQRQPRAVHPSPRWYHYRLPRRRRCWWMGGGNSRGSWKKKQAKRWSTTRRRWVPKFRVPASMRAAVAALLRPMNLCGWRAPGMRAPRNTTQFIMHQVYQDMRRQEKEAAASKGAAAVSTVVGEKPAMQHPRGNNICNLVAENFSHMVTLSAMSPERCISDGEEEEERRQQSQFGPFCQDLGSHLGIYCET
ncbi:unnamed protein product [Caretta caretta]